PAGNPSDAIRPPAAPYPAGQRPITSVADISIGTVLDDKYLISVKLGQGGMGAVFRAKHKLLQKDVALKVIAPQVAQDPSFKARFFREAKVAMEFMHRHAVPVRDFGVTSGGLFYMTMDYVSGVSLRSLVEKEGSLEPGRACRILHQILGAVGEAHTKHIIHRDLKPDNVMVETDEQGKDFCKVLDFGLAKIAGGDSEGADQLSLAGSGDRQILGTVQYMSPEQACGEDVDSRTDIYACGIILYQLLTGELPFKALTTRQMILKQVSERPRPLKELKPDLKLPEGLEAVVMRALAKDKAERFQLAEDFAEALEPYIAGTRRRLSSDTTPTAPPAALGQGPLAVEITVGATIDRYKIVEKIAEGGFGAVYKAEHTLMHRMCAFKVMKPGLSQDEEFVTRFQREAQVSSKFKHPNAVEIYDFGKVGNQLFMAMELVDGKPLTRRMRGEGPPVGLADAVEVFCQVLDVLDAAHRSGIVHRDLKPDNIMLNSVDGWPNQVKVLDFGIAKMKDASGDAADFKTVAGSFFGTPQYASPEQCRGELSIDGRSDLYSMGVILFEMLTGKLPYESETAAGFLAAHMVTPPRRARDVKPGLDLPPAVEDVVLKALEKSRENRFQSAREFSDALKAAAGISPVFEIGEKGVKLARHGAVAAKPASRGLAAFMATAIVVLAILLWQSLGAHAGRVTVQ
ncbi:MAG TPA: serine/threonine-protein kinase, partial [Planctomycetota bacterium]|nr:serine/threonine-protein kinase [Planctomycetota bacterium]